MVSFAAEPIIRFGFFTITNSFLDVLLVDTAIIGIIWGFNKKASLIPGAFQNFIEMIVETFYNLTESVAGGERTPAIFSLSLSFFIFILFANWSGLIPGLNSVGFYRNHELVPFLRAGTSDLNVTLALALVSAIATHIYSLKTIGIKSYLGRYFSLNPINLYVGLLELVSEVTKVISLSFRLFGNIFAGEIVLATISTIFAFVFPLPFLLLEIVVGFIQALVFAMLTLAFMAILSAPHQMQAKEVNHA